VSIYTQALALSSNYSSLGKYKSRHVLVLIMTISPETIKKIIEMEAKGFPRRQISQKLEIALNTIGKYIKCNGYEENHADERKEVKKPNDFNKLEEELTLAGLKPEIQERLFVAIDFLEDVKEPSSEDKTLLNKANCLWDKLEDANDIETVQWIETKCGEITQMTLESMEQKIDRARDEEEKRVVELQKQQEQKKQRLRKSLEVTLTQTDELLAMPFSNEEKQDIFNSVMPWYEQPRFEIADVLKRSLGNHILDPQQRDTIIHLWYQNYV